MDHKTDTDSADLGFYLEERGSIWVVQFAEGGCRPATFLEKAMWNARQAGRASLAASAGSEPVAWQVWVGLGEMRPHWPPFKTQNDAADHASMIKSRTEVRPLYTHPSPPEGAGWISVTERLPEWAARDDTPCFINGKEVPPTLTSETVLVALKGGGVRTDKLTTIEGKSDGWWHTYGERVVAWQKTPAPPASEAKERGNG